MMRSVLVALAALGLMVVSAPASLALRQFIVFFEAGDASRLDPVQWQVSPAAEAAIRDAADVQRSDDGFILLIGGDSPEMALERSRRRAQAVKDVLIAQGVPADATAVKPCGFLVQLVDAPVDVDEPQNRFVAFAFLPSKADLEKAASRPCEQFWP